MTAADNVSPRQFLYHEAHLNDRESIRSGGLRPGKEWRAYSPPGEPPGEVIAPAGVYLSPHGGSEYGSSMHSSRHFGYDTWRADVTDLDVRPDPTQPKGARYTPQSIPAERIKLVKKGHPDWEKHI